MNWLQIRLFGSYFRSFSTNSYGYYSQMSQNLISNGQIFASVQITRQTAKETMTKAGEYNINNLVKWAFFLSFREMNGTGEQQNTE